MRGRAISYLNVEVLQLNIIPELVVTENDMRFCVIPRNSLKLSLKCQMIPQRIISIYRIYNKLFK